MMNFTSTATSPTDSARNPVTSEKRSAPPKETPRNTPSSSQTTKQPVGGGQAQPNVIGSDNDHLYKNSRILVVDDNPQNVELLEAYLSALPCKVSSASDGLEAIAAVESNPPDLILLDVMMPKMSGFEVCQRLKNDPATRDIPILMVTALNEVGDVERGADAGTDDFLSKPFNKIELLTRVRSLLRIRYLKKELDQTIARTGGDSTGHPGNPNLDDETSPGE